MLTNITLLIYKKALLDNNHIREYTNLLQHIKKAYHA